MMNDVGRIDGTAADVIDCEGAIIVEERCFVLDDDIAATLEGVLEADENCMVATVVYAAVVDITGVEVDSTW